MPAAVKILVVEDQPRLGHWLEQSLIDRGNAVSWAQTCVEALTAVASVRFDAILLDLSLPDGDGLVLLQAWRRTGLTMPVMILNGRPREDDLVRALDCGADDYLPKPFKLEELLARLRSLLRRQTLTHGVMLQHRGIRMDLVEGIVTLDGADMELTAREFALLELFLRNIGKILPRSLIAEKIWDSGDAVAANLLDVYMSKLRGKFDVTARQPLFRTIRGVGYQML